jgi:hypothetical protein
MTSDRDGALVSPKCREYISERNYAKVRGKYRTFRSCSGAEQSRVAIKARDCIRT